MWDAPAEDLLAGGWQQIRPSAYTRLIGPIYHRQGENGPRFCFRVDPKHDNSEDRPHGGMIMAFCDEALGLTARSARPGDQLFTISFDCQFIGGSSVGELVEIEPVVTKATASLMFMRGICRVGDRIIASSSGVWKAVRGRTAGNGG